MAAYAVSGILAALLVATIVLVAVFVEGQHTGQPVVEAAMARAHAILFRQLARRAPMRRRSQALAPLYPHGVAAIMYPPPPLPAVALVPPTDADVKSAKEVVARRPGVRRHGKHFQVAHPVLHAVVIQKPGYDPAKNLAEAHVTMDDRLALAALEDLNQGSVLFPKRTDPARDRSAATPDLKPLAGCEVVHQAPTPTHDGVVVG